MNEDLKRWLLHGLGLSKKTVGDIEKEVQRLAKKYGWTLQEAKEIIKELTAEGKNIKEIVKNRAESIRTKAKDNPSKDIRRIRKKARKIIRKASKTAAKKIKTAGKRLARRI